MLPGVYQLELGLCLFSEGVFSHDENSCGPFRKAGEHTGNAVGVEGPVTGTAVVGGNTGGAVGRYPNLGNPYTVEGGTGEDEPGIQVGALDFGRIGDVHRACLVPGKIERRRPVIDDEGRLYHICIHRRKWGGGNRVQFPADIEVFSVAPPALDDIHRWMRDRSAMNMKSEEEEEEKQENHPDSAGTQNDAADQTE